MNHWPHSSEFSNEQQLVCVPPPEPFESPASWLSQLALSQGVAFPEVTNYLKLDLDGDVDMKFVRNNLKSVAAICGLEKSVFGFMAHMFSQLRRIDALGSRFLLSHNGLARYRFCSQCLAEQRTPHFPLHWRFNAWRWCPLHNRLMSDHCPQCKAIVVLPADVVSVRTVRQGSAQITSCMVCGSRLSRKPKNSRFYISGNNLLPKEHFMVANGRSLLAALYANKVTVSSQPKRHRFRELLELEQAGYFAHTPMHYEQFEVNPDPRYRHPLTNELCGTSSPARARYSKLRAKAPFRGLFD